MLSLRLTNTHHRHQSPVPSFVSSGPFSPVWGLGFLMTKLVTFGKILRMPNILGLAAVFCQNWEIVWQRKTALTAIDSPGLAPPSSLNFTLWQLGSRRVPPVTLIPQHKAKQSQVREILLTLTSLKYELSSLVYLFFSNTVWKFRRKSLNNDAEISLGPLVTLAAEDIGDMSIPGVSSDMMVFV